MTGSRFHHLFILLSYVWCWEKKKAVMVSNSTNINNTNNYLKSHVIEHKKRPQHNYTDENPGPGLGQVHKCVWVKPVDPNPSTINTWISNNNTDINKQYKIYAELLPIKLHIGSNVILCWSSLPNYYYFQI